MSQDNNSLFDEVFEASSTLPCLDLLPDGVFYDVLGEVPPCTTSIREDTYVQSPTFTQLDTAPHIAPQQLQNRVVVHQPPGVHQQHQTQPLIDYSSNFQIPPTQYQYIQYQSNNNNNLLHNNIHYAVLPTQLLSTSPTASYPNFSQQTITPLYIQPSVHTTITDSSAPSVSSSTAASSSSSTSSPSPFPPSPTTPSPPTYSPGTHSADSDDPLPDSSRKNREKDRREKISQSIEEINDLLLPEEDMRSIVSYMQQLKQWPPPPTPTNPQQPSTRKRSAPKKVKLNRMHVLEETKKHLLLLRTASKFYLQPGDLHHVDFSAFICSTIPPALSKTFKEACASDVTMEFTGAPMIRGVENVVAMGKKFMNAYENVEFTLIKIDTVGTLLEGTAYVRGITTASYKGDSAPSQGGRYHNEGLRIVQVKNGKITHTEYIQVKTSDGWVPSRWHGVNLKGW